MTSPTPSGERRGTIYLPRTHKPMFITLTRYKPGHRSTARSVNMVHVVDIEQYNDDFTIIHLSDGSDALVTETPATIFSMMPEDCIL